MYRTIILISIISIVHFGCSDEESSNNTDTQDSLAGRYDGTIKFEEEFDFMNYSGISLEVFEEGSLITSEMDIYGNSEIKNIASISGDELKVFLNITNLAVDDKVLSLDFRATTTHSNDVFTAIDNDTYLESDDPYLFEEVSATLILTKVD